MPRGVLGQDVHLAPGFKVPEVGAVPVQRHSLLPRLERNQLETHNHLVIRLQIWQTVGKEQNVVFSQNV